MLTYPQSLQRFQLFQVLVRSKDIVIQERELTAPVREGASRLVGVVFG